MARSMAVTQHLKLWQLLAAALIMCCQLSTAQQVDSEVLGDALGDALGTVKTLNVTRTQVAKNRHRVRREDILVTMPVDEPHIPLARASRAWRKGMKTVIAGAEEPSPVMVAEGQQNNEVWVSYPDDVPLRSLYAGDSRAAMLPFLAHRAVGDNYKWLLYGDDDTVWFMDSLLTFLEDFDPDMPYFITDHMWWSSKPGRATHPNKEAPRCLPCDFNDDELDKSRAAFNAPKGCPCTPALICQADERGIFNEFCDIPRAPTYTFSMHGGAGAIISVGLMRAVGFDFMEKCVQSLYSTGGDAFISICLWQAGYWMTDPGYTFYHPEVHMMDPGPEDRMGIMMKLVRFIDSRCDETCQHQLDKMVTLHVRSRVFPTLEDASQFIKAVSSLYDVFIETKRLHTTSAASAALEVDTVAVAAAATAEVQALANAVKETLAEKAAADAKDAAGTPEAEAKQQVAVVTRTEAELAGKVSQVAAHAAEAASEASHVASANAAAVASEMDNVKMPITNKL